MSSWYCALHCLWPKNLLHSKGTAERTHRAHVFHCFSVSSLYWSNWLDKMVACLLKTQVQCQLSGRSLETWGNALQKAVCAWNQRPAYDIVSPVYRAHRYRMFWVEMEIALKAPPDPSNPLAKYLFTASTTLCSTRLKSLGFRGRNCVYQSEPWTFYWTGS